MADSKPPCLTVLGGPMAGTRFILQDGVPNILVGSEPACAFHLPLPGVSAMHARISVEPGGVSIWEAGSTRGLHVNDTRVVGSAPLRNGDIVWLGTPGEADVVMLQCILPRLPSLTVEEASAATLFSAPAPDLSAPEPEPVEGETVALDPQALSLDSFATPPPAPEPAPEADLAAPIPLVVDTPLVDDTPEEAGMIVDPEAETFIRAPESVEPIDAPANVSAQHDFVLADDGAPLTVDEPVRSYPPPPPAPVAPTMPPGFEDETEERLVEAATFIAPPVASPPEPTTFLPASEMQAPPAPAPAAPKPTPAPASAPARPAAGAKPAPRPAPAPATRKPGPSVSQRTTPAERPAAPPPAAKGPKSSSSTGLYVGIGLGALVVLAGGAFALMKFLPRKDAQTVANATPPPPTSAPTAAPTPAAVAATPEAAVSIAPTPVESLPPVVVATPTPVVTGKPTPSPSPTKGGPTPAAATPTPAAVTPTGPSPEQLRAQQVASLFGQAEAAQSARQYDQAVAYFDEVLKIEPGNARATSERAAAVAARDMARRRFVAGRTIVTSEKGGGGGISGFEGAAVQKAPDFLGRIEFEMSPSTGLKGGDPWTLKFYVVNEGKKAIRITDLTATALANGERSGGAASARVREVAPQQRVQVGEMAGAWKDGTQSWSAEVLVTAKDDSLKNTLTWR